MTDARSDGLEPAIATASPARLLVMLYERLVLDVQRGIEAQRRNDFQETHRQLTHAQAIVSELQASLPADQFRGGYDLSALYGFLHRQLVKADVGEEAAVTDECLRMVTDLCESWREAALASADTATDTALGQQSA